MGAQTIASAPPANTGRGHTLPWRRALALCLIAAIGATAIVFGRHEIVSAEQSYQQQVAGLDAGLSKAHSEGYGDVDLEPVVAERQRISSAQLPWLGARPGFYRAQTVKIKGALDLLDTAKATALANYARDAAVAIQSAGAAVDTSAAAGADPVDTKTLRSNLSDLNGGLVAAKTPVALKDLAAAAAVLTTSAIKIRDDTVAESNDIAKAAQALLATGNLDAVRKSGSTALAAGHNDAVVATLMKMAGLDRLLRHLDGYAGALGDVSPEKMTVAVAGTQLYAGRLHTLLLAGMPAKAIVLSLTAQELWAYEGKTVVKDTLVTTGKPALATDVGAMKVLSKQAPWKMHSPWPKGSPYWYPDIVVQKVVWFTTTGEGLHDASWEPASDYGPGSQLGRSASHGCVHIPNAAEDFLYSWAETGTPVIVFPGDGSAVADQMKQVSVDANGVPFTGPKGA